MTGTILDIGGIARGNDNLRKYWNIKFDIKLQFSNDGILSCLDLGSRFIFGASKLIFTFTRKHLTPNNN